MLFIICCFLFFPLWQYHQPEFGGKLPLQEEGPLREQKHPSSFQKPQNSILITAVINTHKQNNSSDRNVHSSPRTPDLKVQTRNCRPGKGKPDSEQQLSWSSQPNRLTTWKAEGMNPNGLKCRDGDAIEVWV
jgi:hypothetical protein